MMHVLHWLFNLKITLETVSKGFGDYAYINLCF